jgi:hypothetical protein
VYPGLARANSVIEPGSFVIDKPQHALSCAVLLGSQLAFHLRLDPNMDTVNNNPEIGPMAAPTERSVQVFSTTVRIRELNVDRPKVAAYLDAIAPDKQEVALIHLIEVGVTELLARRDRFKK